MTNSNNLIDILIASKEVEMKRNSIIHQFKKDILKLVEDLNVTFNGKYNFIVDNNLQHSSASSECGTYYTFNIKGIFKVNEPKKMIYSYLQRLATK